MAHNADRTRPPAAPPSDGFINALGACADEVLYALGVRRLTAQDYRCAVEFFRQALARRPRDAHIHFALGLAYQGKFELELAAYYLTRALSLDATLEDARSYRSAVAFRRQHMSSVPVFDSKESHLAYALSRSPRHGLILEAGVGTGTSLRILCRDTARPVYGFDSFEGLPEGWIAGYEAGAFACAPPSDLPENARLVVGRFGNTLGPFLDSHSDGIAFIHFDCDLYSSTKTFLEGTEDRLLPGAVLVFDEYINFPTWMEHEFRAFREFVRTRRIRFRYLSQVPGLEQVGVRIETAQT